MINLDQIMATPGSLTCGQTYEIVLRRTRERLADPENWTQEAHARDEYGHPVKPRSPRACCWCLLGGVAWASNGLGIIPPPLLVFLEEMMIHVFGPDKFASVGAMNDYVSHDVVLNFLDTSLSQFPK